jgi:outer membrane protein assembly factor BamB
MAIVSRSKDKRFPPGSANYTAVAGWYSSARLKTRVLVAALVVPFSACTPRLSPPPAVFPMTDVWKVPVEDGIDEPPASDGTRLFVATHTGGLLAFGLEEGALVWGVNRAARSVAAAPGLLVIATTADDVMGVDPDSGNVRWKVAAPVGAALPPVLDGGTVYVAGDGVVALDAANGRLLWESAEKTRIVAPPAIGASLVVVGEADGTIRCRDRETGDSRWAYAAGGPLPAPAVVDPRPRVLVGTAAKAFLALEPGKGRVRWRWRLGADVREAPIVYEKSVLFASHEAVLYALNRESGHLNWRAALPARPLSAPLVYGTAVLVACFENQVVGFDVRTGRPLGVLRTTAPIRAAPILVCDRLFVVQRDRTITAHALNLTPAVLTPLPEKGQKGKAPPRP